MLSRHSPTADRDAILARIATALPGSGSAVAEPRLPVPEPRLVPARVGAELHLPIVEDATALRAVLEIKYFSASRGHVGTRVVSPERVILGPPARLLAVCHRAGGLRWFRIDNITSARLAGEVPFREADPGAVEDFLRASLNGFHGGEPPLLCRFRVRNPDARWMKANLPEGATAVDADDAITVEVHTSGLLPLARLVVGLGDAAVIETPELAELVQHLARGALRVARPPAKATALRSRRRAS
jgi:predicted DNA-binding transcriptional regulator YafY